MCLSAQQICMWQEDIPTVAVHLDPEMLHTPQGKGVKEDEDDGVS